MIIRILGEGQFRVADDQLDQLNEADRAVSAAIEADDEQQLAAALEGLQQVVRNSGEPLADDELVDSDLIVPSADASLDEVRGMLDEDGLIPG